MILGKFAHMEDIGKSIGMQMQMKQSEDYKAKFKKYKEFIQPVKPEK